MKKSVQWMIVGGLVLAGLIVMLIGKAMQQSAIDSL